MKADKITGFALASIPHKKLFDGNIIETGGNFYVLDKSTDTYLIIPDEQLQAALINALRRVV